MTDDPLSGLMSFEGVPSAFAAVRDGIDAMLRDRGLRRTSPETTAESLLRGAHASAVLEGSASSLVEVRDGRGDEVAQASLRVSTELLGQAQVLGRSPGQALARLHTLADFHAWPAWSPWEKLDPALRRTFSGAPSGKGAVYEWAGDGKVGAGRMEITDAVVPSKVAIQLDFAAPIEARNVTAFTLAPAAGATNVTWDMSGPSNYLTKVMGVFVSMDSMIGKDFEAGLANLKAAAEK